MNTKSDNFISRIIKYITEDIWRIRLVNFSRGKYVLIRQLRIVLLALRGFGEDKCFLRASSLTFYFLFSIVPVLAMIFGIAKGFGIEKNLEEQVLQKFQGQQEIVTKIMEFSHSLLERTKGGIIAGIGLILLIWTVIRVLSNIENSFNEIWGIRKSRSPGRKFSDYLAIVFICPVLLVIAGSLNVVLTANLSLLAGRLALLNTLGPFIIFAIRLSPYIIIWLLFSFLYSFMPNTRVNIKSAVLGGIVAGTMYQFLQWAYLRFQVGVSTYGAIYGSFAAVPLFLMWIQVSWLIILFGTEISFAHQNVETYEFEHDCLKASYLLKKLISLATTHLVIKNFSCSSPPLTASAISQKLEVPIRLINEILYELLECGIISEVRQQDEKNVFYQPACDTEILTVKRVIDALEKRGSHNIPLVDSVELEKIKECMKTFSDITETSSANIPLKNI